MCVQLLGDLAKQHENHCELISELNTENAISAVKPLADIPGVVAVQITSFLHILRIVIAFHSFVL